MSTELALNNPTSVMANSAAELRGLGAPVIGWARKKMDEARAEHEEFTLAVAEAKKHKWKTSTLQRAARKALMRFTFYEKCVAALEAGYILFPLVDNADVIAIRTNATESSWDTRDWPENCEAPALQETLSEAPVKGEGEYKSPWTGWRICNRYVNDTNERRKQWETVTDLAQAEFPVVMAKPQIIEATNAAMEMKVFDEIRLFPFQKKRGDPCILGAIIDKSGTTERRHMFLISWLIQERDI